MINRKDLDSSSGVATWLDVLLLTLSLLTGLVMLVYEAIVGPQNAQAKWERQRQRKELLISAACTIYILYIFVLPIWSYLKLISSIFSK